jgi:hypothetical protein
MEAHDLRPQLGSSPDQITSASACSGLIEFIENVCDEERSEDYLNITARPMQSRRMLVMNERKMRVVQAFQSAVFPRMMRSGDQCGTDSAQLTR